MSTVHPEMIEVLSIKVFKANIDATNDYLEMPVKPDGVSIELGQNTVFNLEKKNIRIRLIVKIEATKNESEKIGLSGEYGIEFHIHVENFSDFIVEKAGKKIIDRKLGSTLTGIVYSTVRGIVYDQTSSTHFGGVILPVIDPNLLLEK